MGSGGWRPDALRPSMSASSSTVAQIDRVSLPEIASPHILRAMKNTGLWTVPALVFAVSMFGAGLGCGETGGGTAGSGGAGGSAGSGGSGGATASEAPVITMVRWNWAEDCMVDKSMAVTIAVSATDDDTDQLSLVYSGTVSNCTPESFGGNLTELSILSCTTDHMGLRFGSVTVEDPEQNLDTVSFTFDPCESGQVCEGGDPCD